MYTIDLTHVGLGIHEELVAYVADQQDYYAAEGVHVALRDGCDWGDERVRRSATIGLGRAVLSRITGGIPWTVLCVNTDRPLFWLLGRAAFESVDALRGRRIGIHAPASAPGCFARIVLRRHGLDPDRDVECVVLPPGDYARHLRLLDEGTLDAAFVGSTLVPEVTAARQGLRVLAFVGDHFVIPTVGVAVDPTFIDPDDPAVAALVRANRRALQAIRDDPDLAAHYICSLIPGVDAAEARAHYDRYIVPYYTVDGRADLDAAAGALTDVAAELGVTTVPDAGEIYRTARLAGR